MDTRESRQPLLAKCRAAWYQMLVRLAGQGRGRGRHVAPQWRASFDAFLEDVGPPPSARHVLCLKAPDIGFIPGNVYWGTRVERQQYVSHATTIEYRGEVRSLRGWAREIGLRPETIRERILRGASAEQALSPTRWERRFAPRQKATSNSSSRFVGVSYRPKDACWEAKLKVKRHLYYLGIYHTEAEAAAAVREGREIIAAFLELGASPDEVSIALKRELLSRPKQKFPERRSGAVQRLHCQPNPDVFEN